MEANEKKAPVVRDLFESLGFHFHGSDIDEAVRWALIELLLRRQQDEKKEIA